MTLDKLKQFRSSVYTILGNAKDALFDLMDAVLVTRSVYSFVELSVSPVFRRQWPSIYEALEDGNPPRKELMELYIKQLSHTEQIVLAGDHTAWPRLDARTLKERTYEHQAITFIRRKTRDRWTRLQHHSGNSRNRGQLGITPIKYRESPVRENPIEKAAAQLRLVCQNLPTRPLSLWDAEYGCASFVTQTADIAADKLMRLRSNRLLYGAPPPYIGIGRPRVHGNKFKLNEPTTWWTPDKMLEILDPKLGRLRLRLWCNLHFQQSAKINMHLFQVERFDSSSSRISKPFWLVWVGEGIPELCQIWRQYLRRFAVDHWYRFAKQRLHWTLPKLGTREQCERWSDLMPLLTWQLWLAREAVSARPLPWQRSVTNFTPGRVAQSIGAVFAAIGTPSHPPKSRGKSPGWPTGQTRPRKVRCPIVKKGTTRQKKQQSQSA